MRALFFFVLSLLFAAPAAANEAAWTALRTGNATALMRHADAPGGFGDPQGFKLEDCATQRNLSAGGRAEAVRVGAAFREHGVKPARIESSPWCRCIDTAKLMDVGPVEINNTFGNPVVWTDRRDAPDSTWKDGYNVVNFGIEGEVLVLFNVRNEEAPDETLVRRQCG